MQTLSFFRVTTDGSTDCPEEMCQVVGLEGNQDIGSSMKQMSTYLLDLATKIRRQAQDIRLGTQQANDASPERIATLVEECCGVPLNGKDTSGYKDLLTGFVRAGLGEMFAAVMRKVGAADIGISQAMFDKGIEVLNERDRLVHRTNSATCKSKGAKKNKRPGIHCTWRSSLMNMCKSAQDWESRASFTSFICALGYSILQGEDGDMLDNWIISETTSKPWSTKGKKKGKGKEEDEVEGNNAEEAGSVSTEGNITGSCSKIEEKLYPGTRGVLHHVSVRHLRTLLECMLRIFAAGGFWLMPHAHAPFNESMLQGSGERPKFVLMKQVQEFVRKNLGVSASGEGEIEYSNWWTLTSNKQDVKEIFSQPKEELQKKGFIWIPVNPNKSAVSMAHTLGNVLHNSDPSVCKDTKKPKKDEETGKDDEQGRDIEGQSEPSKKNEEEAAEISRSPVGEEHSEDSEDADTVKLGKRRRKEEKVLTVEEHDSATKKAIKVCGFLLALAVPNDSIQPEEYMAFPKPVKRTRQARKPRGNPSQAGPHGSELDISDGCQADVAGADGDGAGQAPSGAAQAPAFGLQDQTLRKADQVPGHSSGPLPSEAECNVFRGNIFLRPQVDLCEFVVAVENLYLTQADFGRTNKFPTGQLFAVFSDEDSAAGKKPVIVFPARLQESEGKKQFKVDPTPVSFDDDKQACVCWTYLVSSEVTSSIRFNADKAVFWFEDRILENAVAQILGSEKMLTMFEESERLNRVFETECMKDPPSSLWLIDTHVGGGTEGVGIENEARSRRETEQAAVARANAARMVIQHALAANTEQVRPELVRDSADAWEKALVARTTFSDLLLMMRKLPGAKNERALALYVDLLNVDLLEKIKGVDGCRHFESHGCESICVVQAMIDHSSETFSNVELFVPSWRGDRRCTERTNFIVLVSHKDSERRSILSLVRNLGSNEDVKACTTVIQGRVFQQHAPKLWDKVCAVSDRHAFLPGNPPTGFLEKMPGVEDISKWTASQNLTSPEVTPDGACWIWAFLVVLGIVPCLAQKDPTDDQLNAWASFWAPVANRFRQLVAAVLEAVYKAYEQEYGAMAETVLFGSDSSDLPLRTRWDQYFGTKPPNGKRNMLSPTCWGSDLELVVGSWLVNINLNAYSAQGPARNLQNAQTRAFHHDCFKKARVTLTGKFPTDIFGRMDLVLPPFHGFVTVDAKKHAQDVCAPGFVEAFGFAHFQYDVLNSSLAGGIARGVLDAHYQPGQSSRSSLFMMFRKSHFSPVLACAGTLRCARKSAGGDVICDRLNGLGGTSPVIDNLLDIAVKVMLEAKTGDVVKYIYKEKGKKNEPVVERTVLVKVEDVLGCALEDPYLSSVHSCEDNATAVSVASAFKAWNANLEPQQVYQANQEVITSKVGTKRPGASQTNVKLCVNISLEQLQLQQKLRKATKLLVPLRAEDVRIRAKGGHKADCDVLHSMITLRCFESVKQANNNGRHAGSLVFGVFSVLLTGLSPSKCIIVRSKNNDSPGNETDLLATFPGDGTGGPVSFRRQISQQRSEGKTVRSVKWLQEKWVSDMCEADQGETVRTYAAPCLLQFFEGHCSLKTLVEFLGKGIGESREYVKSCAKIRQTCKGALAMCPKENDLWRAAFYAQSPRFQQTHGDFGATFKATVVPASSIETVGDADGGTVVRKRHKDCQQLLMYISPRGGEGVYAVTDLDGNVYLTEYSGRYLDRKEAEALTVAGKASHVRSAAAMTLHIDGNPEREGFSKMQQAENHQASVWNRVSL